MQGFISVKWRWFILSHSKNENDYMELQKVFTKYIVQKWCNLLSFLNRGYISSFGIPPLSIRLISAHRIRS